MYEDIWTVDIGEELMCSKEPSNVANRYVAMVPRDRMSIEYFLRKILKLFFFFLKCPTRSRPHSANLLQGEGLRLHAVFYLKLM